MTPRARAIAAFAMTPRARAIAAFAVTPRARAIAAFAVITVAALAVFGPALVSGEVFNFRDHADYFQPLRFFTTQHLRAGRLPLWNPYNASGEPWMANPQTGVFYPPAWLFLVLPFATAYVGYLTVHALLLGWGSYLLFSRSAGFAASLAGSVAVMTSGPMLSLLDVSNNYTTLAWLPLVICCALRDCEDRDARGMQAGILLALSFLAGEPFYAAVAALLYAVIVRRIRTVAVAALVAAGLSAIQLLPFAEMVAGSNRIGGFERGDILRASMPLRDWLLLAVPPRLARSSQQFIFIVYAGALVVALAVAGAISMALQRRWTQLAGWMTLLLSSIWISTGPAVLAELPLTIFRYPARVVPLGALAIAAFAVAGWQRLRRGSAIVDAVIIIAIVVDLRIAAKPLLVTTPFVRARIPYDASIGRDRKILQDYRDIALMGGSRAAWVSGYLNLLELRFAALTAAPVTRESYMRLYHAALSSITLVQQMGVGTILTNAKLDPPFVAIARVEGVTAYRVDGAWPMAYVREEEGGTIAVRRLALDARRALAHVDTPRGGILVLTQNDAPGWHARVDGEDVADVGGYEPFRAVRVSSGSHDVIWTYRPASLRIGAGIGVFTLLAMFLMRRR